MSKIPEEVRELISKQNERIDRLEQELAEIKTNLTTTAVNRTSSLSSSTIARNRTTATNSFASRQPKQYASNVNNNGNDEKAATAPKKSSSRASQVANHLERSANEHRRQQRQYNDNEKTVIAGRSVYSERPERYKTNDGNTDLPSQSLSLDFIYGYDGEYRNNIYWNSNNEICYAMATFGVIWSYPKMQQRFTPSKMHTEDITAFAMHPNRQIAATGQRDVKGAKLLPYFCIWNAKTGELINKFTHHQNAVSALTFSPDGSKLISMGNDSDHSIAVWDWERNSSKPIFQLKYSKEDVFSIRAIEARADDSQEAKGKGDPIVSFVSYGVKHFNITTVYKKDEKYDVIVRKIATMDVTKTVQQAYHSILPTQGGFLAGTHDGHIYVFDQQRKLIKYFKVSDKPISVICAMDNQGSYIAGSYESKLHIFSGDHLEKAVIQLPENAQPRSIDYCSSNQSVVIGTKSSDIMVCNIQNKQTTIIMRGHNHEVHAVDTHPTQPLVVMSAWDKRIRQYDYNTKTLKWSTSISGAVQSLNYNLAGTLIAVGCLDGTLVIVNSSNGSVVFEKKYHKERIGCMAFSPDGSTLVTGGWDQLLLVINTNDWSIRYTLKGHTASPVALCVAMDNETCCSNGSDYDVLYWNIKTGKRLTEDPSPDTIKWHKFQNYLGWQVQGIYAGEMVLNDINSVVVSGNDNQPDEKRFVACARDDGELRLYRYPVLNAANPKYSPFYGHSSHCSGVAISSDDQVLFTTGGNDWSLFQWKINKD